jgi:predicted AAA+ superfamily ATPase
MWQRVEAVARSRGKAVIIIDEIQHLDAWAQRIKGVWDKFKRDNLPIHMLLTGSSALKLGRGAEESLAGRFERSTLLHWSAADLAAAFSIEPEQAARDAVIWGGYPGSWSLRGDAARWGAYIRDAIIEPAIGLDILAFGNVRKPALLRQVFAMAVSAPAQIVALSKLQGQLQDKGALETVAHALEMLEEAYLVASVRKFAATQIRQRNAPPKLGVLNNALSTVLHWQTMEQLTEGSPHFGNLVENACLAHALNHGQTVHYWRREPFAVDGVFSGSWGRWTAGQHDGRKRPVDSPRRRGSGGPGAITPGVNADALPLARRFVIRQRCYAWFGVLFWSWVWAACRGQLRPMCYQLRASCI